MQVIAYDKDAEEHITEFAPDDNTDDDDEDEEENDSPTLHSIPLVEEYVSGTVRIVHMESK